MKEGACGELKSTIPPVTATAWASFLTGKNPGKTGIYDFFYLKEKWPPKVGISSGSMIRKDNILTILSDHGFRVASINIPMTYPPYRVNGVIVSGIETPRGRVFAYPLGLYFKLVKEGYFPELDMPYIPGNEKEFLSNLYLMIEKRNKLFFTFLNDRSFNLILLFFRETDIVSHAFWRFMDEKSSPLSRRESIQKRYIGSIQKGR